MSTNNDEAIAAAVWQQEKEGYHNGVEVKEEGWVEFTSGRASFKEFLPTPTKKQPKHGKTPPPQAKRWPSPFKSRRKRQDPPAVATTIPRHSNNNNDKRETTPPTVRQTATHDSVDGDDDESRLWKYGKPSDDMDMVTHKSSSEDDDSEKGGGGGGALCCCFCCTPQILLFLLILLLAMIMCMGLGIWLGVFHIQSSSDAAGASSSSASTNTSPTLSPTQSPTLTPTLAPYPTATPSLRPTNIPSSSPTAAPSSSPTDYPTYIAIPPSNITVGVYYYPWHADDFHNGQGYLRRLLQPRHEPTLGEYDDRATAVITQHLAWSRQANVRLWITSWWGPNRDEDTTTRDRILNHHDLGEHQIALLYESTGRIKRRGDVTTANVASDIEYICDTYFDHPNYYRVNGRPVLFVYVSRVLEDLGVLEESLLLMRGVALGKGYNVFLVGDHAFQRAPSLVDVFQPLYYLDAVTNYDMYGAMRGRGGYAGQAMVDQYVSEQRGWRQAAHQHNSLFIPCVSPGFNDRGVRLEAGHPPLSRKLVNSSTSLAGSLFRAILQGARFLVDPGMSNLLLVNSFNEWHEDTQIEPAIGNTTSSPFNYTLGMEYEGYGELYLDILRNETQD